MLLQVRRLHLSQLNYTEDSTWRVWNFHAMLYYAGLRLVEVLWQKYHFSHEVLVYCRDVAAARGNCQEREITDGVFVTAAVPDVMRYIQFKPLPPSCRITKTEQVKLKAPADGDIKHCQARSIKTIAYLTTPPCDHTNHKPLQSKNQRHPKLAGGHLCSTIN
eukprot:TRINITY_DN1665_c0_g1_i11.p1 TRINITY_DN1665_c0_g1~~TRINITY_DN1665_c0_g1_i11.p1  ORF type:complete len:162 (+),score=16.65 TRINITY_DN1665_c0_g1_i11:2-487(+)